MKRKIKSLDQRAVEYSRRVYPDAIYAGEPGEPCTCNQCAARKAFVAGFKSAKRSAKS